VDGKEMEPWERSLMFFLDRMLKVFSTPDSTSQRGYSMTDGQIDPLDKSGVQSP